MAKHSEASCNSVRPFLFRLSTWPILASNNLTMSARPLLGCEMRRCAVWAPALLPPEPWTLTSDPLSISSFVMSRCPIEAAQCNAVRPPESNQETRPGLSFSSSATLAKPRRSAALCTALIPSVFLHKSVYRNPPLATKVLPRCHAAIAIADLAEECPNRLLKISVTAGSAAPQFPAVREGRQIR
jgi:hypothetical protein